MKRSHGSRESLILCIVAHNAEHVDAYRYLVLIRLSLTDTLLEHVLLVSEVTVKVLWPITPVHGNSAVDKTVPKTVLVIFRFHSELKAIIRL